MTAHGPYARGGKRALDVLASAALLAVLAPAAAVAAVAVRLSLGAPVLFRQERPGFGGRPFLLYKFRTMRAGGAVVDTSTDAARLTRVGRWLRATSVDEIPQLWNVLRGDMSLVGPRPLLMQYLPLYTPAQARRHEVRPGITGLAQVSGRNAISWEEKFALDVRYVDELSLALDVRILLLTVRRVLAASDVSAAGHATVGVFRGSEPDRS